MKMRFFLLLLLLAVIIPGKHLLVTGDRTYNDDNEIQPTTFEENDQDIDNDQSNLEIDMMGDFFEEHYNNAIQRYGLLPASNSTTDVHEFEDDAIPDEDSNILMSIFDYFTSFFRDQESIDIAQTGMAHRTLHWFRKGLRLHDNPALLAALEGSKEFRPIFILDPHFVRSGSVGVNRWRFLLEALQDLDDSFKKFGSRLYVLQGTPTEVLPRIFKEWNITRLTFEMDTEPYAKQRDAEVYQLAGEHGVEVIRRVSHTLYVTDSIIKNNGGKPPLTYQRLQTVLSMMGRPQPARPTPTNDTFAGCKTPISANHDTQYGVPTLEQLGLDPIETEPLYPGGETEALKRMQRYLERQDWIAKFEKPKTEPNSIEPSTTVLSPYLKFGCLSPRRFYHAIHDVYRAKKNFTKPPVSLEGQLLWREFFYTAAAGIPNFHKMEGNSVCAQVPWDNNTEYLEAWKHARTGFPYIDAIMIQLRREGWIHHLARHSVACFLTRGDLWISWEEGQKVFDELLLDADYSLNAGNWMWLSASAFFHQYFRVYSPVVFGKKTDPNGLYIKKYLPMLKKYPAKYIYEPWNAPRSVQEQAGCIIGQDYPRPIVDHSEVSKRNIGRMKAARACAKTDGNDSKPKSTKRPAKDPHPNSSGNKKNKKSR